MSIETSENRPLLSQINTQTAVADPMDDVIVDRNDMRRGSDFAERRHTSGKVVDRIEALESAAHGPRYAARNGFWRSSRWTAVVEGG
jgi:hypothetical protein